MKENLNLDINYLKLQKHTLLQILGINHILRRSRHLKKIKGYYYEWRNNPKYVTILKGEK